MKGEKTESVDSARNKGLDQFVELAEISRILGAKL